jgi:hypothetical protein
MLLGSPLLEFHSHAAGKPDAGKSCFDPILTLVRTDAGCPVALQHPVSEPSRGYQDQTVPQLPSGANVASLKWRIAYAPPHLRHVAPC